MSTSGTVTAFTVTRNELIRQAALDVGAIAAGVPLNATQLNDFVFLLNSMIAEWSTRGIKVWTVKEALLFPVSGQRRYKIGGTTGNAHCCDGDVVVKTTLAADAAAAATALTVTSDDGITDGWQVGIMLESGDFHWSTVSGAPAGDVVTIAGGLASSAVSGAALYAYPADIEKPIRITEARRVAVSDGRRVPFVRMYAHKDFMELPDADSTGAPYAPYYDRQLDAGYLSLIPPPANPTEDLIGFTWHRGIEDFTAAGDNPAMPKEWVNCLQTNLAAKMLPRYPNPVRKDLILNAAAESLDAMSGMDREEEAVFFQPEPMGSSTGPWGS